MCVGGGDILRLARILNQPLSIFLFSFFFLSMWSSRSFSSFEKNQKVTGSWPFFFIFHHSRRFLFSIFRFFFFLPLLHVNISTLSAGFYRRAAEAFTLLAGAMARPRISTISGAPRGSSRQVITHIQRSDADISIYIYNIYMYAKSPLSILLAPPCSIDCRVTFMLSCCLLPHC